MRLRHAAFVAGLAFGLMSGAAHAALVTFNYTGDFQTFIAPSAGVYDITAYGAQGGTAYQASQAGGLGAEVSGDFSLTKGESLTILVGNGGGYGGPSNGLSYPPAGGGGGSYVCTTLVGPYVTQPGPPPVFPAYPAPSVVGYVPLAIAAGGGGAGDIEGYQTPPSGGHGDRYQGAYPLPGFGGDGGSQSGGSGAGFYGPGTSPLGNGLSPVLGGQGSVDPLSQVGQSSNSDGHGGFGGGGGGGGAGGGPGGGGGYVGGMGGILGGGEGGYSYLADGTPMNADYLALSSVREGDGLVTINLVSQVSTVPLPASAPMFGAALLALGAVGYGLKRKRLLPRPDPFGRSARHAPVAHAAGVFVCLKADLLRVRVGSRAEARRLASAMGGLLTLALLPETDLRRATQARKHQARPTLMR